MSLITETYWNSSYFFVSQILFTESSWPMKLKVSLECVVLVFWRCGVLLRCNTILGTSNGKRRSNPIPSQWICLQEAQLSTCRCCQLVWFHVDERHGLFLVWHVGRSQWCLFVRFRSRFVDNFHEEVLSKLSSAWHVKICVEVVMTIIFQSYYARNRLCKVTLIATCQQVVSCMKLHTFHLVL